MRETLTQTSNVNFYQSALAKKIKFNQGKRATGVLVNTAGVEYTILADKKVILLAGAVSIRCRVQEWLY